MKKRIGLLIALCAAAGMMSAARHEPYTASRIFWDYSSRQKLFDGALYARMIELQDGRLMAVTNQRDNIVVSFSSDKGIYWSDPKVIATHPDMQHLFDAEAVQLRDGTIIVPYNIGTNTPYSDDRHYGVQLNISTDNGQTWGQPITVYTAGIDFGTGCWEPAILEMPSGELHLYFSDESPYPGDNHDQCIQLTRSFDKGRTWSPVETISYRPGARDGMPVPNIIGDSIVVTIEDSRWPGEETFVPVTLRCSLEENWQNILIPATSERRNQVVDYTWCPRACGGAPYLCRLPWGETVLSRQSYYESGNYDVMNMYVYVGDENARGFKAMSQPFPDNVESKVSIEWNSIAVVDTGVVIALGGVGAKGSISHHVDIVRGYPMRQFTAYYGTPDVDGTVGRDEYHTRLAQQVMMGTNTIGERVYADFNYDERNLYFVINVADATPASEGTSQDAVHLLLDPHNLCETLPSPGVVDITLRTDGTCLMQEGKNYIWTTIQPAQPITTQVKHSSRGYVIEAAIPWQTLGHEAPPQGQRMGVAIEVQDRRNGKSYVETIPDVKRGQSWTYMTFRLEDHELTAIDAAPRTLSPSAASGAIYDLQGRRLVAAPAAGCVVVNGRIVRLGKNEKAEIFGRLQNNQ